MISAGTPIIYALIGDLIGQRSGIISLSVEGSMLCGACLGFSVASKTGNLGLTVICAGLGGAAIGLVQAFLSITRKSNMMTSGFILIFFAQGLTTFFGRGQLGTSLGKTFSFPIPLLSRIPVIGPALFQQDILERHPAMSVRGGQVVEEEIPRSRGKRSQVGSLTTPVISYH